jgi:Tetratricopeptide repeat
MPSSVSHEGNGRSFTPDRLTPRLEKLFRVVGPQCSSRALTLTRERGERGHEAWALRLLGEIASHHDHLDVATTEAHYGTAMTLASELGMRPLVAHCHLGLGKLYRRTGRREQAREHLTTATTMYREMDMRFWLEQAEAEVKVLG